MAAFRSFSPLSVLGGYRCFARGQILKLLRSPGIGSWAPKKFKNSGPANDTIKGVVFFSYFEFVFIMVFTSVKL
jgi:hypothetical protein